MTSPPFQNIRDALEDDISSILQRLLNEKVDRIEKLKAKKACLLASLGGNKGLGEARGEPSNQLVIVDDAAPQVIDATRVTQAEQQADAEVVEESVSSH